MQKGICIAALWGVAGSWQLQEETVEYGQSMGWPKMEGHAAHQEAQGCTDLQCDSTAERREG